MEPIRLTYYSSNRNNLIWSILIRIIFLAICIYLLFEISLIAYVPDRVKLMQANTFVKPLLLLKEMADKSLNSLVSTPRDLSLESEFDYQEVRHRPGNRLDNRIGLDASLVKP